MHSVDLGDGTPVLFQHGLAANLEQIKKLFGQEHDFRLLAMDAPGHGKSLLQSNQLPSFDHYADLLVEYLESKGIRKCIVGGLSMGAGIAFNVALRYPSYVKALILLRPAWLDKAAVDNLGILIEALPYMKNENGYEDFAALPYMKNLESSLPLAANSILGVFSDTQQSQMPLVIEAMVKDAPIKSISDLKKISCPCLIMGSENDPLHPYNIAEVLHTHIGHSNLYQIESNYVDSKQYKIDFLNHASQFIRRHG